MSGDEQFGSRTATVLRIVSLLRPHPVQAALSLLLGIGSIVLATRLPLVLGDTIDRGVLGHDRAALVTGAVAFTALAIGRLVLSGARRAVGGSLGLDVEFDLRNALARQLLALDLAWHGRARSGQLLSRVGPDVAAVRTFVSFALVYTILNALTVAIVVVQLWVLSPRLAVVTLAFGPVMIVLAWRYNRAARRPFQQVQSRSGDLATAVEETAAGIAVVRAFGREDLRAAAVAQSSARLASANLDAARLQARYGPFLALLPDLGLVALLGFGGHLVVAGEVSLGTLIAADSYLILLIMPLSSISLVTGMIQRAVAGAERVFRVLDTRPTIVEAPDAVDLPTDRGRRGVHVRFEDVTVHHPGDDRAVFEHLTLELEPGERVALVGGSGTGKSTAAATLLRACDPDAGRILLDGVDIRTVTLRSLRTVVAVVNTEPVLFAGTVRDNIAFGAEGASDDEVRAALRTAAALDFVDALPDGLDTVVGERGTTLSGGQRQRLAIARAVVTRPRLLVLDDALTQLDALTAATVLERLDETSSGVTVLSIASRHGGDGFASRVVVLDPAGPTTADGMSPTGSRRLHLVGRRRA